MNYKDIIIPRNATKPRATSTSFSGLYNRGDSIVPMQGNEGISLTNWIQQMLNLGVITAPGGGGSNLWSTNGSDVWRETGQVMVGTDTPQSNTTFTVESPNTFTYSMATNQGIKIDGASDHDYVTGRASIFGQDLVTEGLFLVSTDNPGVDNTYQFQNDGNHLIVDIYNDSNLEIGNAFYIEGDTGNIGIGTPSVPSKLSIEGNANLISAISDGLEADIKLRNVWGSGNNYGLDLTVNNTENSIDSREVFRIKTSAPGAVAANRFEINRTGALRFFNYGTNSITGTPAYALAVDASGNVIETALGGGGGSLWSTDSTNVWRDTGKVMVGASTPGSIAGADLEVTNQLAIYSGGGDPRITFYYGALALGSIDQSSSAMSFDSFSSFQFNNDLTPNILNLSSAGHITAGEYGSGSITGTATYSLAVDATGKIIETALGGGGSDTHFADTNLTATGARTHDFDGNNLTIENSPFVRFTGTTSLFANVIAGNLQSGLSTTNGNQATLYTLDGGGTDQQNVIASLVNNNISFTGNVGATAYSYSFPTVSPATGEFFIATSANTLGIAPYVLPTADGTSGQVLQTDGAGNVTFQTPVGGGSDTSYATTDLTATGARVHTFGAFQVQEDYAQVGGFNSTMSFDKDFEGLDILISSDAAYNIVQFDQFGHTIDYLNYGSNIRTGTVWDDSGVQSYFVDNATTDRIDFDVTTTGVNFIFNNTDFRLDNDPGTNGQVLTSSGTGSAPTWTTIAGGGGSAEVINVLTEGIDNTGATDETVAINNLISSNPGKIIYFPEGLYQANIDVTQSVTLLGEGYVQVFKLGLAPVIEINAPCSIKGIRFINGSGAGDAAKGILNNNENVRADDCYFLGFSHTATGNTAFSYYNNCIFAINSGAAESDIGTRCWSPNAVFRNCEFIGHLGADVQDSTFYNCTFGEDEGDSHWGVHMPEGAINNGGGASGYSGTAKFYNCTMYAGDAQSGTSNSYAIGLGNDAHPTLVNCTIKGNGYGLYVRSNSTVNCIGCTFEAKTTSGAAAGVAFKKYNPGGWATGTDGNGDSTLRGCKILSGDRSLLVPEDNIVGTVTLDNTDLDWSDIFVENSAGTQQANIEGFNYIDVIISSVGSYKYDITVDAGDKLMQPAYNASGRYFVETTNTAAGTRNVRLTRFYRNPDRFYEVGSIMVIRNTSATNLVRIKNGYWAAEQTLTVNAGGSDIVLGNGDTATYVYFTNTWIEISNKNLRDVLHASDSGNIGINDGAPSSQLSVGGDVEATGDFIDTNGLRHQKRDKLGHWTFNNANYPNSGTGRTFNTAGPQQMLIAVGSPDNTYVAKNDVGANILSSAMVSGNDLAPIALGDKYLLRMKFTAESTSGTGDRLVITFDDNGGANTVHRELVYLPPTPTIEDFYITVPLEATSNAMTNGISIYVEGTDSTGTIYDINFKLQRTYYD